MAIVQLTTSPDWAVGYVYLFNTSDRYQKIGYSKDPFERVEQFQHLPFAVWLDHFFPVGTVMVEAALHMNFARKRARGEWFILSPADIAAIKEVGEARTHTDLPTELRRRVLPPPRITKPTLRVSNPFAHLTPDELRLMRPPRPWFRHSRGQWYVSIGGRQRPLGVTDPDDADAAMIRVINLIRNAYPVPAGQNSPVGTEGPCQNDAIPG